MAPQQQKGRRYFIKTYGCQMNEADSAKLASVLASAGYQDIRISGRGDQDSGYQEADIVLVNTCVVRQNAEDKAAWYIQSLKGIKKKNPGMLIGVCGCMVTEPGKNPKDIFPHVDLFIEPNNPGKLKEFLLGLKKSETLNPKQLVNSNFEFVSDFGFRNSSYVSIMHGCDNFCSYCVVPYVRGHETSRTLDDVLAEIKGLIDNGATNITLLGQNVNSYKFGLANLLYKIQPFDIGHLSLVIKFMTSHPRDMSGEIIETVAELPYVAKEFHLPLQAGDDEILARMNRGYTVEYFKDLVKKIRSVLPAANISTDVMVGFPGETEAQFENLLALIKELKFSMVNMFAFSPRPETLAAKMPDLLPDEVKQARLRKLIDLNRKMLKV